MKKSFLFILLGIGISACDDLTKNNPMVDASTIVIDSTAKDTLSPSNGGYSNQTVNNWVYDLMLEVYLWGDELPTKTATNRAQNPREYFYSILYKYPTTDRFSWIEEDAEELANSLNGISKAAGFSFVYDEIPNNPAEIFFITRYVIRNSPAEKAGLKRGDIITKVNGVAITEQNRTTILANDNLVLTLGEFSANSITSSSKSISVTKEVIQNYPVHFNSVIEQGNKKIGYLVYNQFIRGIGDNNQFDEEMRAVFADFKAKGVNELVLDLRYNGGGYISCSNILSSLIVKDLKPGTLMNKEIRSKNFTQILKQYYGWTDKSFETNWLNEANNIGGNLSRVFILTSNGTASASELVINNLKPFMDVVLIGSHTYGKDVGSITLDDESNDYRWKWAMQPIVLRTVNALGQADYGTVNGFKPDVEIADNIIPFQPFGSKDETLLRAALDYIGGSTSPARIKKGTELNGLKDGGGLDNPNYKMMDMFSEKAF